MGDVITQGWGVGSALARQGFGGSSLLTLLYAARVRVSGDGAVAQGSGDGVRKTAYLEKVSAGGGRG